jgi:hypothetical protein
MNLPKYSEKDISRSVYRYLVTYSEGGITKCFYTHWFEPENNFNKDLDMVVTDLVKNRFTNNGVDWQDIEEDNL